MKIPIPLPFALLLVCCSAWAQDNLRLDVKMSPLDGINTEILVSATFLEPVTEARIEISRLCEVGEKEIRSYNVSNLGSSPPFRADPKVEEEEATATVFPADENPSPHVLRVKIHGFLELGRYRVEMQAGQETASSPVIDTSNFVRISQLDEEDPLRKIFVTPQGTPRTSSFELSIIDLELSTKFLENGRPRFEWRPKDEYQGSYFIYLVSDEQILWSAETDSLEIDYSGPTLELGKTYVWTVGGVSEDGHHLRVETLGRFMFSAPLGEGNQG